MECVTETLPEGNVKFSSRIHDTFYNSFYLVTNLTYHVSLCIHRTKIVYYMLHCIANDSNIVFDIKRKSKQNFST